LYSLLLPFFETNAGDQRDAEKDNRQTREYPQADRLAKKQDAEEHPEARREKGDGKRAGRPDVRDQGKEEQVGHRRTQDGERQRGERNRQGRRLAGQGCGGGEQEQ